MWSVDTLYPDNLASPNTESSTSSAIGLVDNIGSSVDSGSGVGVGKQVLKGQLPDRSV